MGVMRDKMEAAGVPAAVRRKAKRQSARKPGDNESATGDSPTNLEENEPMSAAANGASQQTTNSKASGKGAAAGPERAPAATPTPNPPGETQLKVNAKDVIVPTLVGTTTAVLTYTFLSWGIDKISRN